MIGGLGVVLWPLFWTPGDDASLALCSRQPGSYRKRGSVTWRVRWVRETRDSFTELFKSRSPCEVVLGSYPSILVFPWEPGPDGCGTPHYTYTYKQTAPTQYDLLRDPPAHATSFPKRSVKACHPVHEPWVRRAEVSSEEVAPPGRSRCG